MAFIDTRLHECMAYGFSGGPVWNTEIVPMDNGREKRNGKWLLPLQRYTASFEDLPQDARDEVREAFYAARGRLHAFRLRDPEDHEAVAQPIVQIGGKWWLARAYTFGTETAYRLVQRPTSATLTGGTGTVNMQTGEVTAITGTPTWTGEFDVWVRFDSDYNAFTIGDLDAHSADIELVEVRR